MNINDLKNKYPEFVYNSYTLREDEEKIYLEYEFLIPNLTTFKPKITILKKDLKWQSIATNCAKNLAFHIGLIELISYWKCTCSPHIIIKCGYLNEEQINWWKKLYFYGLSELFYRNIIENNINDFVTITCTYTSNPLPYKEIEEQYTGYLFPIGGGKDSIVTLEKLNIHRENNLAFIINPKEVTLNCAKLNGFQDKQIIEVYRTLDENLLRLNKEGFINGHTPFSALLAFVSYFVSYLLKKEAIALSNEASANEENVLGLKVNHQYSKSFEFEQDFKNYSNKYLKVPVRYFSFLRPLNELQIAKIFVKYDKYHQIFKSCNVGSKTIPWHWCNNCAKCLFPFIILSPFLTLEKLEQIFKENLWQKEDLLPIFIDLIGKGNNKPFDCVGTFEEVNWAVCKTIKIFEEKKQDLPYLLKYYKDNFELVNTSQAILKRFNEENYLTAKEAKILRKEVENFD